MKKFIIFALTFLILLTGCSQTNKEGIPNGYFKAYEVYNTGGVHEYVDYGKYKYINKNKIIKSEEYKKVYINDVENIKGYFDDFKKWMESESRLDDYDFDDSIINEGDYVRIVTKEGQPIGNSYYKKYDDYHVYFFDIETKTLYYIHSNI